MAQNIPQSPAWQITIYPHIIKEDMMRFAEFHNIDNIFS